MHYRRLLALLFMALLYATAAAGAPAADPLTAEQRAWLDAHPVIRLAPDPDFAPLEFFIPDGTYSGLAADYARLVARKLGCAFTVVRCATWSEVLEKAQRREVDLLNVTVRTPERERYLRFARPYLHLPMVIIARQTGAAFADAHALSGKRVALVRNYAHAELIVRENPAIRPLPVTDVAAGLRAVAFGEADAFYHDLATASLGIERAGITTLRVTGTGSVDNMSGFAVRRDWEPLIGILERGMALVTPAEFAALQARWISMRVPPPLTWRDYLPQFAAGIGIAALLLVLALLGNLVLKREVARRTQALLETERTLRAALRIGQMGYGTKDAAGSICWSPELYRQHGLEPGSIAPTAENLLAQVHPDDRERVRQTIAVVMRGEFAPGVEFRTLPRDGRSRWLYGEWHATHDARGTYAGLIRVTQDITVRKEHEQELRRERDFAEQVMNAQTDTVVIIAPDGSRLIRWNRAACVVTGYSDNELARLPLPAVHPPRCAGDLPRALAALERDGELTIELPLLTKDGRELPYEFNVTLVRDGEGQPRFLCSVGRDVTERNAIAQVLRASEARLRSVLETLPFDIWMMDIDGRYVLQNEASRCLWGDVTGKRPAEVARDDAQRRHWAAQNRAVLEGKRLEGEVSYTVDGVQRDYRYVLSRIAAAEQVLGIVGVNIDITDSRRAEHALRASEERYRSLFTTMTDGVALHELVTGEDGTPCDYRILDVNPAYEQILGVTRDQVAGRLATEAYGVAPAPYLEEFARVARSGVPHGFTTYFAPMQRHFKIAVYAPAPDRFATVFEDVTDRLRTESALRESQEVFSAFMRHSPVYTFIKEVDATSSRVLQASDNYVEMIGVTAAQMRGKTMDELFPADFARKITADDRAVVQGGTVLKLDEELNGRHYTSIKFPIVQGGRTLLAGYTIDITERVRAEQELRASTERYQTLFSVETDAILLTDAANGRIVEANPAACQCHGYDHAAMLRLRLTDLSVEPEETQRVLNSDSDEPIRIPLRWHRKRDGSQFPVEITARFFTLAGRRLLLGTLRDIGERLRQEAERERLLAALTAANNDLRSLDELKSNLLSNVSHELRTPLVAVRGYAEMMREGMSGPVTARQGEQFGIMLRNIDRLLTLIDNLLDYSRQQKGQEPLQCAAFPVAGLVHDTVTLLLPRAQEKQVTLHVAAAGDGLELTADRRKLQQVLINLVDNALKFTPQGGTVTLDAASPAAGTLCLTVQDTGVGIPEHQHVRIFERFYQVDGSSTRGHSGTGIGLAIVRDIVTLHGGTVSVASTPGEGTIFTVTLPLAGPAA